MNSLTDAMSRLSMKERIMKRRKSPQKSSRKQSSRSMKRRMSTKRRRNKQRPPPKERRSSHSFSSPVRFVDRRRDPRSRDRPYNKYTPKRSPGGRWKGKGRKHIVAMTSRRSKPYYCGDMRTRNIKGENTEAFHKRRMRDIALSLRLCMEELPMRQRRNHTQYEQDSNRKWISTVRRLIRKFERSKRVLKKESERTSAKKMLRVWEDKFAVRKINF